MRRALAVAAIPAVLLAAGPALPCGAAFGPSIRIDARQDIILTWKDNVETYAFQPVFCGTSTDFGLILPVPAPLSQQPTLTDQQVFTTAARLSQPTRRRVDEEHSGGIGCGSGGLEGSKNATADIPTVVASGHVGLLDWVQLKADTVASFTDWLDANGYPYSDQAASVFSYYVSKGWYFIAFRISQEAVSGGGTICRALGPIALSFATPEPVIPSRMANAGGSGQFAWRIFGVTHGDVQLAFADGANTNRVLWYSGAISDADAPAFAGLAAPGDRLTRLALTFSGGLADPDVGLTVAAASDYRGVEDAYVYDDAACSVGRKGRSPHHGLSTLSGLALLGLVSWRRWR